MGLRFIQYLWFTLLAMVLPSQALSCPTEGEPNRQLITKNAPLFTTQADTLAAKPVNTPGSTSFSSNTPRRASAILHAYRFDRAPRFQFQPDDEPLSYAALATPVSGFNTSIGTLASPIIWYVHGNGNPYRLAGWKETNALYVALNSQFPFSS